MLNKTLTRRNLTIFLTLSLSFSFFACGGASSKGGEKSVSAYEELSGLSAALQAKIDETMAPITESDAIINDFTELPKTLALSTDDFKSFIISAVQGEIKAPEGMAAEASEKLIAFGERFVKFKEGLMATPDRATELVKELAVTLTKVPVLVTKIEAESKITQNNPFASAKDKAEAKKQSEGAKQMGEEVTTKVKEIQTTATGIPADAKNAIAKFTESLKSVGIDNLGALTSAPQDMAKEAVEGAKDVADTAVEGAKDSVNTAVEGAKEAAE